MICKKSGLSFHNMSSTTHLQNRLSRIQEDVLSIPTKSASTKVGTLEDELYKVLKLLEEIDDKAKKIDSKDNCFKHVVHQLLQHDSK